MNVAALALVVLHLASAFPDALQPDCSDAERTALARVLEMIGRGDEAEAAAAAERGLREQTGGCDAARLARTALLGWHEARNVAPKGGAAALLGPVHQRLDQLRAITNPSLAIEVEYAQVAIRAAVSAAQDERPEMELLLQQARDLSERLTLRQRRAMWPRPFNLLAGELWFEVDRYAEAVAAFERATAFDCTPLAYAGLGRALDALGRHDEACRAFKAASGAGAALRDEVAAFLAGCR